MLTAVMLNSVPANGFKLYMLGSLRVPPTIAAKASPHLARAIASRRRVSAEGSDGLQRFPGGVWSVVRTSSSTVLVEAGWLLGPSLRRVASRAFAADGHLLHTSFATERRGSAAGASPNLLSQILRYTEIATSKSKWPSRYVLDTCLL